MRCQCLVVEGPGVCVGGCPVADVQTAIQPPAPAVVEMEILIINPLATRSTHT